MDLGPTRKTALALGSSQGLGYARAQALAREGASERVSCMTGSLVRLDGGAIRGV